MRKTPIDFSSSITSSGIRRAFSNSAARETISGARDAISASIRLVRLEIRVPSERELLSAGQLKELRAVLIGKLPREECQGWTDHWSCTPQSSERPGVLSRAPRVQVQTS